MYHFGGMCKVTQVTPTGRNWFLVKCRWEDAQALFFRSKGSIELRLQGKESGGLREILDHADYHLRKIHDKWKYEIPSVDVISKLPEESGGKAGDIYIIQGNVNGPAGREARQYNYQKASSQGEGKTPPKKKAWWKKPEVLIPILIGVISFPWWPAWYHGFTDALRSHLPVLTRAAETKAPPDASPVTTAPASVEDAAATRIIHDDGGSPD